MTQGRRTRELLAIPVSAGSNFRVHIPRDAPLREQSHRKMQGQEATPSIVTCYPDSVLAAGEALDHVQGFGRLPKTAGLGMESCSENEDLVFDVYATP